MRIHILGSGSRGNAIVLEGDRERVMIDAGFGPRTLAQRLRVADIEPASISALIVTHEHLDHIGGAAAAAARWRWKVYATAGTLDSYQSRGCEALAVETRRDLLLDEFTIRFVRTTHDAREPVALVATSRSSGTRVGIAYDLGLVTPRFARQFADVDAIIVEANHDEEMLRTGGYPWSVKQRIAGVRGHLSNEAAGALVRACVHRGLRHVVLCHISEHNNRPAIALRSMQDSLRDSGFCGEVTAASQDVPMTVTLSASRRPAQLALAL